MFSQSTRVCIFIKDSHKIEKVFIKWMARWSSIWQIKSLQVSLPENIKTDIFRKWGRLFYANPFDPI